MLDPQVQCGTAGPNGHTPALDCPCPPVRTQGSGPIRAGSLTRLGKLLLWCATGLTFYKPPAYLQLHYYLITHLYNLLYFNILLFNIILCINI